MEIDCKADPIIHLPCKVPHPLRDQLAKTLEDMVKQKSVRKGRWFVRLGQLNGFGPEKKMEVCASASILKI